MSRDHRKLKVFLAADALVFDIYNSTKNFPAAERFGMEAQLRRAALSVSTNIVEGSARRTTREYVNFLNIAAGGAAEARYLASVAARLGWLAQDDADRAEQGYAKVSAMLEALIQSLSREP